MIRLSEKGTVKSSMVKRLAVHSVGHEPLSFIVNPNNYLYSYNYNRIVLFILW